MNFHNCTHMCNQHPDQKIEPSQPQETPPLSHAPSSVMTLPKGCPIWTPSIIDPLACFCILHESNLTYVLFSGWLLLLDVNSVRLYVVNGSYSLHNIPFIYSVSCWQEFGLFPAWGYYEYHCYEHSVFAFGTQRFIFLLDNPPRSGIFRFSESAWLPLVEILSPFFRVVVPCIMDWTVSLPKFTCWSPNPLVLQNVTEFRDRAFKEVIMLKRGHQGEP